jgi:hypothetical protein
MAAGIHELLVFNAQLCGYVRSSLNPSSSYAHRALGDPRLFLFIYVIYVSFIRPIQLGKSFCAPFILGLRHLLPEAEKMLNRLDGTAPLA